MKPENEVLIKARKLIEAPGTWTQGTMARDKSGKSCFLHLSDSVSLCMLGAISLASGDSGHGSRFDLAHNAVLKFIHEHDCVTSFNDAKGREQADVLAVMDEAIEATA